MHPEPEDTRKAVREPGGEESTDKTEEVVKNRDRLGDDHRKRPGAEGDSEPDKGGELGSANHVLDYASNDNGGDGNAPDDLSHQGRTSSRESRRGNIGADKDIDDNSGEDVEDGVDDLEESQGLGPVLGLFELGDDAEEARECAGESKLTGNLDASTANGALVGDVANGDENGDSDGNARRHGHIARVLEGSGQVENPEDGQSNHSPDDGASRSANLENDLRPTKDLLEDTAHSDGLSDDFDGVTEVLHEGVLGAELSQHKT
ncbi:hypothetical protein HG530_002760 [Fusarium avenaceum]|nr:hypothetical protein HG530_002760 [Fusarium avenaceum]